jgi:hypothetical protein
MMWTFWWSNLRLRAYESRQFAIAPVSPCSRKVLVYRTGLSTIAPVEPTRNVRTSCYHNNMVLHVWVYLDVFMVTFCTAGLLHRRDGDRFGNEVRLAHGSISEAIICLLPNTPATVPWKQHQQWSIHSLRRDQTNLHYYSTLLFASQCWTTDDSSVRLHLQILSEAPPYLSCKQTVVIQYP